MTVREDVLINVEGSIQDYLKELRKIPGQSDKVAVEAAKALEKANTKAAKQVEAAWSKAAGEIRSSFKAVAAAAPKALAGAFVAATVGAAVYISELMAARTETIQFSEATAIALDTLTAVDAAFDKSGRSSERARDSFADFGEILFDFDQGGGRAKEALELLGFTAGDAAKEFGGVDGALREVLRTLPQVEDEVKRNAIAQQLFGDAGLELIGVLGDVPLEEFEQLARDTGRAIDEEAVEQTERWNSALAALSGQLRLAGTEMVDFIDAGSNLENTARGFAAIEASAKAAFDQLASLGDITSALASADAVAFADAVDAAFAAVGDAAVDAAADFDDQTKSFLEAEAAAKLAKDELGKLTDRQKAAEKAAREAAKAFGDAARGLADEAKEAERAAREFEKLKQTFIDAREAQRALGVDLLTGEEAARAAVNETRLARLASINEIAEVLGDTQELADLRQETNLAFVRELDEFETEAALKRQQEQEDFQQAELGRIEERSAKIRDAIEQTAAIATGLLDTIGTFNSLALDGAIAAGEATLEALDTVSDRREALLVQLSEATTEEERLRIKSILAILEAEKSADQQRLADQRATTARLFSAEKGLRIASAITSGAAAAVAAFLPPPIGAGPVGGAVLLPVIAGATAAQIAVIGAQQAPQFHAGFPGFTGGPDEMGATVRRGEEVLSQQDAENRRSDREDRRRGDGGGMQGARLIVSGRAIGRVVADEMRRGRELTRINSDRVGIRPVYNTR